MASTDIFFKEEDTLNYVGAYGERINIEWGAKGGKGSVTIGFHMSQVDDLLGVLHRIKEQGEDMAIVRMSNTLTFIDNSTGEAVFTALEVNA